MEVDGEQGWFKRVQRRAVDAWLESDGSINRISAIAPHAYFGHQRRLLDTGTTAAGQCRCQCVQCTARDKGSLITQVPGVRSSRHSPFS